MDTQSTSPSISPSIFSFCIHHTSITGKVNVQLQTSQTKRCLLNIRILLEVRSFAAPKHVQKTCCCTEWKPLGVAVSLHHRYHWSNVTSHWHRSHATHPLFILRLGKWLKGARRDCTVQNETLLVSQSGVSYPSAVLQGSSAIY